MDEAAIGTGPAGPRRDRAGLTDSPTLPTFSAWRGLSLCALLFLGLPDGFPNGFPDGFTTQVHALPDDADQPIHFRADNMEGDLLAGGLSSSRADGASQAKRAVATGSVQVDQGSMRLEADRVVIESVGDQITLVDAQGDPARYRQQPEPGAGFIEARAANIVYRPADARIELIGRALLTLDSDEFRGDVITYDMRQGKVVASGENEGVEIILQPDPARPGSAREHPSHEKSSARGNPSQNGP